MNTEIKSIPIPATFWPQFWARLQKSQPKFYQIIVVNSLWFTAIATLTPLILSEVLPGFGVNVPPALTYANKLFLVITTLLAGAGAGAGVIAKTTLNTVGTPDLVEEKPTVERLAEMVKAQQVELTQLRQMVGQPTVTPPAPPVNATAVLQTGPAKSYEL